MPSRVRSAPLARELMATLHITTIVLGVGLAAVILFLVRRDHLHLSHAMFWICVVIIAAVFGLWPTLLDRIAAVAGISYSPALLLLGAIIVLFVKSLHGDIANTRVERQVRRLNQRLAIFESDRDARMDDHESTTHRG